MRTEEMRNARDRKSGFIHGEAKTRRGGSFFSAMALGTSLLLASLVPLSPAAAQSTAEPPEEGQTLSSLIGLLERVPGFLFVQSARWNGEVGRWQVNYRDTSGLDKSVYIDPLNGEIVEAPSDGAPSSVGQTSSDSESDAASSNGAESAPSGGDSGSTSSENPSENGNSSEGGNSAQ